MTVNLILGFWHYRQPEHGDDTIVCNFARRSFRRGSREVSYSKRDFHVAMCIIAAGGDLVPTDKMIEALWGDREDGGPLSGRRSIDVSMCHLRKTIASLGVYIETVPCFGYRADFLGAVAASEPVKRISPRRPRPALAVAA